MRLTAWSVASGSIAALLALVTNYVAHYWFAKMPFVYPVVRVILAPMNWIDHFFWPHRWTTYTPYRSYSTGGPPQWLWIPLCWLWLALVAFLIGAVAGRIAQSAMGSIQRYVK